MAAERRPASAPSAARTRAGRRSFRSSPDVEEQFLRIELAERRVKLTERRFDLFCRGVLLVLAVALAVTAIICALAGSWPLGASATIAGTLSAAVARAGARH